MGTNAVCAWCARAEGALIEVALASVDRLGRTSGATQLWVHREHEEALRRFHGSMERHGRRFLWTVLALALVVMPALMIFVVAGYPRVGIAGIGLANAALGAVLTVLPFPTPETLRWLGAATAVRVVRFAGMVVVAIGIGITALAFLASA